MSEKVTRMVLDDMHKNLRTLMLLLDNQYYGVVAAAIDSYRKNASDSSKSFMTINVHVGDEGSIGSFSFRSCVRSSEGEVFLVLTEVSNSEGTFTPQKEEAFTAIYDMLEQHKDVRSDYGFLFWEIVNVAKSTPSSQVGNYTFETDELGVVGELKFNVKIGGNVVEVAYVPAVLLKDHLYLCS